ncbi:zinc-ribbon domain-containing protein [Rhodovarius sp.]|uniref:zinc-ribbon domain-containing protein n=1 Tax=Rhodovarius sp. TaxID=2972673 RepID=UPI003341D9E6
MQLACPACAAIYSVPDSMIGEGRMMHCARCAHEWFARPLPPGAALPKPELPAAQPEPTLPPPRQPIALPPPSRLVEPPPPPPAEPESLHGPLLLRLAWLASLCLVAWGVYFLWAERARMTEIWPPIARLYRLLGA